MIDRQMVTPCCHETRAGVNERLRYEAKARCILTCRATFNAGERGGNAAPALFSMVFLRLPLLPHSPHCPSNRHAVYAKEACFASQDHFV